jgi:hypothetical protein
MRLVLPLGISALLLVGCNSGLDQQSATKVMTSALTGTASAQAQFKPTANNTNGSVDVTLTNPAGSGSAHVTGSATQTSNGWNVTFDITFSGWTDLATNVTLDGALHETASFTTMSPFVGDVKLTGNVKASGAVQASVDFDVDASYSPTAVHVDGDVGGASLKLDLGL